MFDRVRPIWTVRLDPAAMPSRSLNAAAGFTAWTLTRKRSSGRKSGLGLKRNC